MGLHALANATPLSWKGLGHQLIQCAPMIMLSCPYLGSRVRSRDRGIQGHGFNEGIRESFMCVADTRHTEVDSNPWVEGDAPASY